MGWLCCGGVYNGFVSAAGDPRVAAQECERHIANDVFSLQRWSVPVAGLWPRDWLDADCCGQRDNADAGLDDIGVEAAV